MLEAKESSGPDAEPKRTIKGKLSDAWSCSCALIFLAIFIALIATIINAMAPASIREWKLPQEYAVWVATASTTWLLAYISQKRFDAQERSLSALHDRLRKSEELLQSVQSRAGNITEQLTRIESALDPLLRALDK